MCLLFELETIGLSFLFQVLQLIFFSIASKMNIFMIEKTLEREFLIIKLLNLRPINDIKLDFFRNPNIQLGFNTNSSA